MNNKRKFLLNLILILFLEPYYNNFNLIGLLIYILKAYIRNHSNGLLAYPAICGSGCNGAYLHYVNNGIKNN